MSPGRRKSEEELKGAEEEGPVPAFLPVDAIQLEYAVSALPQNLSLFMDGTEKSHNVSAHLGVIHKGSFLIYQVFGAFRQDFTFRHKQSIHFHPSQTGPHIIKHAKWLKVTDDVILVLSTSVGYHFYTHDGGSLISNYDYDVESDGYGRSITSWNDKILIGNERGELLWFEYNNDSIYYLDITRIHQAPLTDMYVQMDTELLVAGDAVGYLSIWQLAEFTRVVSFKTTMEECVTSCAIWKHYAVATYGSGIIRLYDLKQKKLLGKVYAHSRWIVTMDLAPQTGLLLTVSEDDLIRVWQLSDSDINTIRMQTSLKVNNTVLVGGKFLNTEGSMCALSSFGSKEVYVYGQ